MIEKEIRLDRGYIAIAQGLGFGDRRLWLELKGPRRGGWAGLYLKKEDALQLAEWLKEWGEKT